MTASAMPSTRAPFTDPKTGCLTDEGQSFLQGLVARAKADQPVAVGASPMSYTAPADGHLVVQGALTGLSLIRGRSTIALSPGLAMVPLSANDRLLLTFSAAPGLVFVPA